MLDRLVSAIWRLLDAILPRPPDDAGTGPDRDDEAVVARLRVKFLGKQGRGGFR